MTDLLPCPPFITIPGLPNFRDLGGYRTSQATTIRRGIIYRSSEPSQLTSGGVIELQKLGITHVYDLRSRPEIERAGVRSVREWEGAERVFAPVFKDEDYSPEAIALRFRHYGMEGPDVSLCHSSVPGPFLGSLLISCMCQVKQSTETVPTPIIRRRLSNYPFSKTQGFVQAYRAILEAGSAESNPLAPFPKVLTHLASPDPNGPTPILVHCTAGKDRTGVLCALVLGLCGVDDETIAEEYALTDLGLRNRKGEFVEHLLKNPALAGNRAGVERMVGARYVFPDSLR
jgi:hypothetical protein